ncbi:hypothetical protein NEISICOT_02073 [Neisseria sicca ATCC 29256]|uniref:Uncharacterized protein n=1 Tax=Neisseria sicca ATCC 29256 TaxID=547045 RepID=C6M6C1_NEISI|nr:hypothetical protein NEISICOT_02073 [Neisseria sicca ATCC 29256]
MFTFSDDLKIWLMLIIIGLKTHFLNIRCARPINYLINGQASIRLT